MSGNQGLSRQFISTILVRGSVELRKRLFVADVSRSGFHVSQSSLSSSRSVGMSLTQASSVTVSASSIHASRMRDVDLMLSMFRSRPENTYLIRPDLEIGRASCRERVCQYV